MLKLLTVGLLSLLEISGALEIDTTGMTASHIANMNRERVSAAGGRCVTKQPSEEEIAAFDIEVDKRYAKLTAGMTSAEVEAAEKDDGVMGIEARGKKVIDVHYHVVSKNDGTGDVSDSDVMEQHRVLKRAFNKNGFKCVKRQITRTKNDGWYDAAYGTPAETNMKSALRVGDSSTLNVYINYGGGSGILGYATFPNWYDSDPLQDGVVIAYGTLPNGYLSPYNLGDTLVHEVGHWLGLYHTFQGGCKRGWFKGDMVRDTPAVSSPNFGCPVGTDSCEGTVKSHGGLDAIHNFMDYTDDSCMDEFTKGQKRRMKKLWRTHRAVATVP